ncbi:UDP-glucose/GDP-mannose dehydrogenase family protein [Halodesulfovibrio sp.]|uniref:UDP-glucose dehydrogenase family protein n=1 Tax=Halodesulfovibrio sp. TaxID=1912772 RepID=UPI0025E4767E|nr:UDP-glucose/GDP-mannose dehydrogenase family protein [Halodesulfovibrio sp.]MCT4627486.1 UDP-glucose/GDP-mannose dehydrogenase family protein [Halodesulfovibrio sp.]
MNVCIVGTGYVGLVSAACFAEMGNAITCVDVNPDVVEMLSNGKVHIWEPGLEELVQRNYAEKRLTFTTSLQEGIDKCDVVFITVGTPSSDDGSCDLCYVEQVARQIGAAMTSPKIIVDKSTVPVGTADFVTSLVQEELDKRGESIDFTVVSNPEFLKEGDAVNDFMKPDRVIVGTEDKNAAAALSELYAPFARSREKLIVMGVRSAEMTKYAANCMLATKISFINEVANICERVGADVRDVRTGIGSDSRIGYEFIYPGVGYGGSCFPKDVKALIHTAHQYEYTPELLEAVENVNKRQKKRMAERLVEYFEPQGGVEGKTLALWGIAFKANTDDTREAAALTIIEELTAKGMRIRAFDPVAGEKVKERFADNDLVEIVDEQYEALDGAQALMVVTEWHQFRTPDFDRVKEQLTAPILFDGRNLYNAAAMAEKGFAYFCIGRKED